MEERNRQIERDLVLAPNEFAFISDETKGHINTYVGGIKQSLANTDRPVIFAEDNKKFVKVSLESATQTFKTAPEGWYIILKNPAVGKNQPDTGKSNNLADLEIGKKVNIPGPVSFPLWPGQMVKVVQGHHLKSNQYLLVRVYDEAAATENWKSAVIKPQKKGDETEETMYTEEVGDLLDTPELTMGKLMIIKGTDVSFFIPPTGIEVVKDEDGDYVRGAVTLERLEHCIRLDENGEKAYTRGPDVVFPKPTETFIKKDGTRKFRAMELASEKVGLHIKVIADYTDADGNKFEAGDELFITGKDQPIYFPREEHAIVKYGDQQVHFATAIPPGEGRYVLDRISGEIKLAPGPDMLLPDPRKEVLIRRVLEPKDVNLWFPGNQEALDYNRNLQSVIESYGEGEDYVSDRTLRRSRDKGVRGLKYTESLEPQAVMSATTYSWEAPSHDFGGDELQRKSQYTKPRQITIDSKYEGVVAINVWTGYAVQVVSKTGERKVVVGPSTYLLQYDESLEAMELSTGTPKNKDNTIKTVYLRVMHNKVSDRIEAETSDLCKVYINLSYCIDFIGDPNTWFDVEDYVGYGTERIRSIVRAEVKQHGVEEFYAKADRILRDLILGIASESEEGEKLPRPGRWFEENNMKIVDVDIAKISIGDQDIAHMLIEAQNETVRDTLVIKNQQRKLEVTKEKERIEQETIDARHTTVVKRVATEKETALLDINSEAELESTRLKNQVKQEVDEFKHKADMAIKKFKMERDELEAQKADIPLEKDLQDHSIALKQQQIDQELQQKKELLQLELEDIKGKMDAFVGRVQAISPQLVAALQALGDKALASSMSEHLGPWAMLEKAGVGEMFQKLAKGTPLQHLGFGDDSNAGGTTKPAYLEEPH